MDRERTSRGEGLSPRTLMIAGVASGVAAVVVPMIWERGTVFAAAATPVIVAVVSEMLKRPVEAVSAVRVRRTPSGTAILDPPEPPPRAPDEPFDPLAPVPVEELEVLGDEPPTRRQVHRRRRGGLTGRQWKLALATGLVAFLVAAAVVTASELTLFGDSVSSGDRRTTFFGGNSGAEEPTPTPDATPTAEPEETPAQPEETPAPEDATPTPVPTEPPAAPTATPPPGATPAPAPAEGEPPAP